MLVTIRAFEKITLENRTFVWYKIRTYILVGVMDMIENYIGRTVQIIYNDRNRKITIRTIQVRAVKDGKVKAFCLIANAPRIFNIDNIIDVELINKHAG